MCKFFDIDTLDYDRELAAALGDMVIAWAYAETALVLTFSRITKVPVHNATIAYYRIPTFESRVKFICALLTEWDATDFDKKAIGREIMKLNALSRKRNGWIHAVWTRKEETKETVIFSFRSVNPDAERLKPVKATDVENHVEAVNKRSENLRSLVRWDDLFPAS